MSMSTHDQYNQYYMSMTTHNQYNQYYMSMTTHDQYNQYCMSMTTHNQYLIPSGVDTGDGAVIIIQHTSTEVKPTTQL